MSSDIITNDEPAPAPTAAPTQPKPAIPAPWRLWNSLARAARAAADTVVAVYRHFAAPIGFAEILLIGGAALVGAGLSFVWLPAALMVPGAVFVYVAITGVK